MYLHCQDSISYPHSHDYTMADGKPAQFELYIHIHVHVVPPFNDKDYISNLISNIPLYMIKIFEDLH